MSVGNVFKFALFVRIFVVLLQVIFNRCVPDHNADAFRLPYEKGVGIANSIVSYLLEGFSRWDAQYFLHISLYSYTHENTLAFFPLFPVLLRYSSNILSIIFPFSLSPLNCTLLAGVLLNCILTSLSTVALYKCTQNVFQSEIFAFTSALLFCINPASIFFSAIYSESFFSLLTFSGLWALEKGCFFFALCGLSLSASIRSNGILSAGFLIYTFLKQHINYVFSSHRLPTKLTVFLFSSTLLKMIVFLVMFSLPFIIYQIYCYLLFCTSVLSEYDLPEIVVNFLTRNDLKVPSEPSKWCFWSIPLSYSYVQSRYWDVGFLRYFSIKQIPNFLLAAPIVIIILVSCTKYFVRHRKDLWHLGFIESKIYDTSDVYSNIKCLPYFLHIFFITVFCILFIHIQVVTRMLCSSSPVLYWVAATAVLPANDRARFKLFKEHSHKNWLLVSLLYMKKLFLKSSIWGKIIFSYFVAYFLTGTFLHVNFFPWT
ncbi:GPI mannosyltransferase 2-like [Argiope bruennichi]|uniref:GPI mannosyltransferase 2 n=1 Tax=Argiope bruennichi TaxID=94029 RepID=A0A8T0EBM4_ARGBR|nr:GPI mannosyltransferase 2-like [Argiope bruennichi]KAF8768232.1 GPI mannosyltransferase 2 like protein [Argiope bruennichi]